MRHVRSAIGFRMLGIGIVAIAIVCLAWGGFDPGQPVPKNIPDRAILSVVAAIFILAVGAALQWRRTRVWGAAAIAFYYGVIVVALLNGRVILLNAETYGAYSSAAEQFAIAAGALIVYAMWSRSDDKTFAQMIRAGQIVFAICAILFGGAHFAYMNLTAPLVPNWLPPSQIFWGYATGIFHIAGGLAILANLRARLAAILLTIMYALFTPLALLPQLLTDFHHSTWWSENALNLALIGAAWTVADSLTHGIGSRRLADANAASRA